MYRRFFLILALATAVSSAPALADKRGRDDDDRDDLARATAKGNVLPLADILTRTKQQITGRVVEIEFDDDDDGRARYEIYWIDKAGRRHETEVDARTGAILKTEIDD
jgi:uncharacterized membrane protein YkoI